MSMDSTQDSDYSSVLESVVVDFSQCKGACYPEEQSGMKQLCGRFNSIPYIKLLSVYSF